MREQRLAANTYMLFDGRVKFLAAIGAFQFQNVGRRGHKRMSLAHRFWLFFRVARRDLEARKHAVFHATIEAMAVRLIALDIDGTLLDSRWKLPEANRAAIAEATRRGIEVALVTGRRYDFAMPIAREVDSPLTMIVSNGALVRTLDGETHVRHLLPRDTAARVLQVTKPWREGAGVVFDRPRENQVMLEFLETDDPIRQAYYARNKEFLGCARPLESCLTEDPLQVMLSGKVQPMREAEASLRAAPFAAEFGLAVTVYESRDFAMIDVIHPRLLEGRGAGGMGGAARLCSRRSHGHRRQPQRSGDAVVRGNPGGDGQRRAGAEEFRLARNRHQRRKWRRRGHRTVCAARGGSVRVKHLALLPSLFAADAAAAGAPARAEYFVLRSGQRLHVTGYQLLGDKYRLQMNGGFVEVPADNVAAIEPEDVFTSAPPVDSREGALSRLDRRRGRALQRRRRSDHQRHRRGIEFRSQGHFAAQRARPDAASAANRRAPGRAKHFRSAGKHRRRNALFARPAAALQERSRAHLGGVQCGTTARPAVRPGSTVCRNAVLRTARPQRLCQAQVGSARC